VDALDRGHAVDARQPHVHQHDLGLEILDGLERLLAVGDLADDLEVVHLAEQEVESLADDRVVVDD
jgi:hypothetical protein